jgi:hypothetical protein
LERTARENQSISRLLVHSMKQPFSLTGLMLAIVCVSLFSSKMA